MASETDIFWIGFGDIHENTSRLDHIPQLNKAEGLLVAGDLTNMGTRQVAEAVLEDIGRHNPRVYAQIGNMDPPAVDALLTERGINAHCRAIDLGHGVCLIGLGCSSPTPFNTPSEATEAQLADWLADTYASVAGYKHLILMSHTPPHGTTTDRIGAGTAVGSPAVRAFIEDRQPDVCLTGHIHESKSQDRIGRTRIVNPGLFADGGYAVIRLRHGTLSIALVQAHGPVSKHAHR